MRLLIKANELFALDVFPEDSVGEVKQRIASRTGCPAEAQNLRTGGHSLDDESLLGSLGLAENAVLSVCGRLRGGSPTPLHVTVKPRIQKDKWSLYWKESMETKTEVLDAVTLELSPTATVADVHTALRKKQGWPAADSAERLEGFKDPWEFAIYKGRIMDPQAKLDTFGLESGAALICVRRVLVPEAWKVIEEGQDEDDLSSDEDW